MKHILFLILASLLILPSASAQKKSTSAPQQMKGLYLAVDAGLVIPDASSAGFYGGKPGVNANTIDRVLKSDLYGSQIWSRLVELGQISPSAIGSYREFQVVEYPRMYYKLSYQLGVGLRYIYSRGWGWILRFDYAQLAAAGQFNISSSNGSGILGSNQYVTCDIYGTEKRTLIDFGITKRIPLTQMMDLELDLGFNLNGVKVQKNGIVVGGQQYSILDVWGGATPYSGIGTYEYINEGLFGYGGFGTVAISYMAGVGSIDFGYNLYYTQTKFVSYNESDSYGLQHNIFLRFNVNNFKLFD